MLKEIKWGIKDVSKEQNVKKYQGKKKYQEDLKKNRIFKN